MYIQWRRQWHPTPVLLPGKSHGWRTRVGCSPWGRQESDMTERLHFHFSLSCIGEGTGNPLQCSCLENPRDGGAWWAAIYGVVQSRTRLKRLSISSSVHAVFSFWVCITFKIYTLYMLHTCVWKVKVRVTQSYPTLWDPMDYTVLGILQAKILEWVAFPFSRGSSRPRNQTGVSCIEGRFFTNWDIREAQ